MLTSSRSPGSFDSKESLPDIIDYSDISSPPEMEPTIPESPKTTTESPGTRRSPKSVWQLACHSLSKVACQKEPFRCRYDKEKQICAPARSEWGEQYSVQWFGSRRLWRDKIIDLLDRVRNGCNISFAENIKVFTSKQSASQSIIISGTIEPTAIDKMRSPNNNVIFKITFSPNNPLDNSLQVEIAIYKNIITRLVNNKNTPHVTSYLGFNQCRDSFKLPSTEIKPYNTQLKEIGNQIDEFKDKLYNLDEANLLITERSSGIELKKWITKTTLLHDLLSVIFQVLYTLNCFARIGLQHNDLHYGNIFIEDMGQSITLFYKRGPHQYIELTTRYIVKIYDWDRGSILHPAVPSNLELTGIYCKNFSTCEYYNPKFDCFQFVAHLMQYMTENIFGPSDKLELESWLNNVFEQKWFRTIFNSANWARLPYLNKPTDAQFKPVKDVLRLFVDHKWSNSPFTIKSGTGDDLPPEIFFRPPEELTRVQEMWYPVSNLSHQQRDIKAESFEEYEPFINPILKVWEDELRRDDHNLSEYGAKLAAKVSEKIDRKFTDDEGDVYSQACWWLCAYQFHRLDSLQQKALVNFPVVLATIDNIWNMFNNKLPISIPRYVMKNINE